jgi:hypothetical protein
MQHQGTILEVERSPHQTTEPAGALTLDFPASRTVINKLVLYKLQSLSHFVVVAQDSVTIKFPQMNQMFSQS